MVQDRERMNMQSEGAYRTTPNQPYTGSTGTNMRTDMYTDANAPRIPRQQDVYTTDTSKNDALSRALLGGLIGATLGSLAGALAGKKIGSGFNTATKGLGEAAKTIGEGLSLTGKGVGSAVKSIADGASQAIVGGAIETAKGVAEGTINAVQTTAEGVDQAVQVGANIVQNTTEGVSQAVRSGADAVQSTAEDVNQSVKSGASNVKNAVENQSNQGRMNPNNQSFQRDNSGIDHGTGIYASNPVQSQQSAFAPTSPIDTGISVTSTEEGSLEDEITRLSESEIDT